MPEDGDLGLDEEPILCWDWAPEQLKIDNPLRSYVPSTMAVDVGMSHLRVWRAEPEGTIAIVTAELGASVTNAAQYIWNTLADPRSFSQPVLMLVQYPPGTLPNDEETVYQFAVRASKPAWRQVWPESHANPDDLEKFMALMIQHGHQLRAP